MLLSLAASDGLLVRQMDVKTAFLNGELEEEIYMDQPDGFVSKGQEGMVCKLLKSLYGLKQAPKQWHEKFDRTLTSAGFVVNETDNDVKFCRADGIGPDKLLCSRYRHCRLRILPMALGILPDRSFMDNFSSLRPFIL